MATTLRPSSPLERTPVRKPAGSYLSKWACSIALAWTLVAATRAQESLRAVPLLHGEAQRESALERPKHAAPNLELLFEAEEDIRLDAGQALLMQRFSRPSAEVAFEIAGPGPINDGEQVQTEIGFAVMPEDKLQHYSATVIQERTDGRTIKKLRLRQEFTGKGGKILLFTQRDFDLPAELPCASWHLKYDRGLLEASTHGMNVAVGACDFGKSSLVGLVLGAPKSESTLRKFVWRGLTIPGQTEEHRKAREEIASLHESFQVLRKKGDLNDALSAAERIVSIVRHQRGDVDADLPTHLLNLALIQSEVGKSEAARETALRATAIATDEFGARHPQTAKMLNAAAELLRRLERPAEARPLQQLALKARQELFGPRHPLTAESMDNLGLLLQALDDPSGARPLHQEALSVYEAALGPDSDDALLAVGNLSHCLTTLKEFAADAPLRKRLLDNSERQYGRRDNRTFKALSNYLTLLDLLTDQQLETKELDVARARLEEAMDLQDKFSHGLSPTLAGLSGKLLRLLVDQGDLVSARRHLDKLYRQLQETQRRDPALTLEWARACNFMGSLYNDLGLYDRANELLTESLKTCEHVLGPDSPQSLRTLLMLGDNQMDCGQDLQARKTLLRAMALADKDVESEGGYAVQALLGLCTLHLKWGDTAGAELLLTQKLHGYNRILDVRPDLQVLFGILQAEILHERGQHEVSSRLLVEVWQISRSAFGPNHMQTGIVANNYARVLKSAGHHKSAEEWLLTARYIFDKSVGKPHALYANATTNLGLLAFRHGKLDEAERHFKDVLEIRTEKLSPLHGWVIEAHGNIGILYFARGRFTEARRHLTEVISRQRTMARDVLPGLSEAEALQFVGSLQSNLGPFLSSIRDLDEITRDVQAYDAVWQVRGSATRALASRRRSDGNFRHVELQRVRRELAQLLLANRRTRDDDSRLMRLRELAVKKESLEQELAQHSSFNDQAAAATAADATAHLPADAALVDIIETWRFFHDSHSSSGVSRERVYEAFVIRRTEHEPGYAVKWIHLGRVEPIQDAIRRWRRVIAGSAGVRGLEPITSDQENSSNTITPDQHLHELVWCELEPHLTGATTVLIVPDGELCQLPWPALPGSRGRTYLVEEYAIATLSYGQQLIDFSKVPPTPGTRLLLAGGIRYDAGPSQPTVAAVTAPLHGLARDAESAANWRYLPGTLTEVGRIRDLAKTYSPLLLSGDEASEARLRQELPSCRIAHLATHGFFASSRYASSLGLSTQERADIIHHSPFDLVQGRNPLTLCGLVLSDVGKPPNPDMLAEDGVLAEDGILSAEEIVDLDLRGVDLVVLSACETGLGAVAGGEGVMGLHRAFALSGARSTIASLWKVDDDATALLMEEFYRNLWDRRLSKLEALRQAQIAMIRGGLAGNSGIDKGRATSPRVWAAFMLAGDWR